MISIKENKKNLKITSGSAIAGKEIIVDGK
jgi:hypothetical protein